MLKLETVKPRKFISPLLSKKSITSSEIEHFKEAIQNYLTTLESQRIAKQSEPNIVTNALKPYFEQLGYLAQSYSQEGQSGIDLALMLDDSPSVIVETKMFGSPAMITKSDINKKALHEAVLYFMREREKGNSRLYHIIITDFYNWFIFDAKDFERLFWRNGRIKKIFDSVKDPSVLGGRTEDFYALLSDEIAQMKADLANDELIQCAYFDIGDRRSDRETNALYKLLHKDTLLKAFNPNDANSLNKAFYDELLYLLGLEEVKSGGKKLIQRAETQHSGALYENIVQKLMQYGKPTDFESVIRLMIIWINRILFLKLLESQLIKWNDSKEYAFLNADKIKDFDRLEMLFFDVLAKQPHERVHREFDYVPYLNSSLFEPHEFEQNFLTIATLQDDCDMPYYHRTVLRDTHDRRKEGEVNMLHYLFAFLDAYDFASEGSEELVSESKTLINASVLGLIFEKLNGYKDGSFYTPSFITMYMSKETITKAIVEKFNQVKGWNCKTLDEIDDKIEDKQEANAIIDSITIVDPAVGSGHFLVSALNTVLQIKSELRILYDAEGKRIRDYELTVENDELIIRDDEGEIFDYRRGSREATRIQKMLFVQKQKIIENSLFGVDINPNSAQITRLRLWIELLKNAYYDEGGHLVTMPNIDINIKVGNSLISRYGLHDEIELPNIKHAIEEYKQRVKEYKEGDFLTSKADIRRVIEDLKDKFKLTLKAQWKQTEEYKKVLGKYVKEFGMDGLNRDMQLHALEYNFGYHGNLFDEELTLAQKKERSKLLEKVTKAHKAIEEIERGKIYEDAFEWRFEFPEVLDEEGNFVGFDVVIGNPPYFNIDTFGAGSQMLKYFPENYPDIYMDKSDILFYFIAKATEISRSQTAYIISNAMLFSDKAKKLRDYILDNSPIEKIINFERFQVFDEASITAMMIFMKKEYCGETKVINFKENSYDTSQLIQSIEDKNNYFDVSFKKGGVFALIDEKISAINNKIDKHPKLGNLFHVGKGMETAANKVFTFKPEALDGYDRSFFKSKMSGEIIEKYIHGVPKEYLLYFEHIKSFEDLPLNIQEYLLSNKKILSNRATVKNEGRIWWRYSRPMHKEFYHYPKIWTSYRAKENTFCLDESSEFIGLTNTTVIFGTNEKLALKYVLALLNSKLLDFRYKSIGKQTGGGIFEYFENQISKLPIPSVDNGVQQSFIDLVDQIITLKKQNQDTSDLEAKIDAMVYKLYGLTDDEIAVVEGREV